MAAVSRPFDPTKTYPVVVSERLLRDNGGNYGYATVTVNDIAKRPAQIQSSVIRSGEEGDGPNLEIATARGEHRYSGRQQASANQYVFLFNEETQTLLLDSLDANFYFEDRQTISTNPSMTDEESIARIFDDIDEPNPIEDGPDPSNPYDWRNQIDQPRPATPNTGSRFEPEPMALDDLQNSPSPAQSPESRPPRRSRLGPSLRKQSARPADFDLEEDGAVQDDGSDAGGGLEIVMDGAIERPRSTFRGNWADAENSASQSGFGKPSAHRPTASSNEDVEQLKLGSPATVHSQAGRRQSHKSETGTADDDDDLAAELMKRMDDAEDADADEGTGMTRRELHDDSSEVSEAD